MQYYMPSMATLVDLHNKARSSGWIKKQKLDIDINLEIYARKWADYMASNKLLIHSDMKNIIDLGFEAVGENIAYGSSKEQEIINIWLKSYKHKNNIMNKFFTHIGCGFSYADDEKIYWCVCFGKKLETRLDNSR